MTPERSHPDLTTRTRKAVCPYCGVGCYVNVHIRGNQITNVFADKNAEPNFGMLCQKGAMLGSPGIWDESARLTTPMLRESRDQPPHEVTWQQAAAFIAGRVHSIRRDHGPDAFACYGSGQLDTEASYLLTKLFKGFLATNNMDTNSRLCMSSAAAAYSAVFGSDGPLTCYDDIFHADVYLVMGANMAANHPVLFNMMLKRMAKSPQTQLIVIDPRRTQTAQHAHLHLPVAPGGDVALIQLIARRLLALGHVNQTFIDRGTEDYDAYRRHLQSLDEQSLLRQSGLTSDQVQRAVEMLSWSNRLLSFYCQGFNQSTSGVDKNVALINLHMQLGELGKPGAGPFSLTGQPNAMGGREVGYLSHQLPGYRLVTDPDHRKQIAELWGVSPQNIQSRPGLSAVDLFEAVNTGEVRGLWICGTNPAVSMPNANRVQQALRKSELVICQDCYHPTETTEFADVLLPAAQWGEKTGTMTNSERLVSRSQKFFDPPGQAMPDWWIISLIGRALGFTGFDFVTAEQVWDDYRRCTQGRPCDQMGMTNARLAQSPLRWPCPDTAHPGTSRRGTDGRFHTESGRAKFIVIDFHSPAESVDPDFPLKLITGRIASQWHTRTRTGKVPELNAQSPDPFVQMHPDDATALNMQDGQWVNVLGRRGEARAKLSITTDTQPGTIFTTFHWGEAYSPHTNMNRLTSDAVDPISKQPELKFAAVRCEPAAEPAALTADRQLSESMS